MGINLLKDVYYGSELDNRRALMRWAETMLPNPLSAEQLERIEKVVTAYFSKGLTGIFGGPILAGDGVAIAAIMEMVRPAAMIEIGVASGFSSAFILGYAEIAGLLKDGETFLHSIDLMKEHAPDKPVGSYLRSHYPMLEPYWDLQTEVTTATLLRGKADIKLPPGPVLAFVDGGHNHPWPIVDLIYLHKHLPQGSWVVLQDTRMMERWIADCVIHGVPSPAPVRGVDFAVSHWPGTKMFGFDTVYNSAAICLDVSQAQMGDFVRACRKYPHEIPFSDDDLLDL